MDEQVPLQPGQPWFWGDVSIPVTPSLYEKPWNFLVKKEGERKAFLL